MSSNLLLLGCVGNLLNTEGNTSVIDANKGGSNSSSKDNIILDTAKQCEENLVAHPFDTGMAVLGLGLGVIGVVASGTLSVISVGMATPV